MEDERSPPPCRENLVLWTWYYRTKASAGVPVHGVETGKGDKNDVTKSSGEVKMVNYRGQEEEWQASNMIEMGGMSYKIDYGRILEGLLNDYV